MSTLNRKAIFLAQLIKEAGKINSEKQLAKMLCYIAKERGIDTDFKFDKNQTYGHYTFEIKDETQNLQNEGLIEFHEEHSKGYWGDSLKRHVFIATEKLKNLDLPLSPKEKRAIHSVYREYSKYSPREIEEYDHAVYRGGKIRTDVELHTLFFDKTKELIKKHKGDENAAFKEWFFG